MLCPGSHPNCRAVRDYWTIQIISRHLVVSLSTCSVTSSVETRKFKRAIFTAHFNTTSGSLSIYSRNGTLRTNSICLLLFNNSIFSNPKLIKSYRGDPNAIVPRTLQPCGSTIVLNTADSTHFTRRKIACEISGPPEKTPILQANSSICKYYQWYCCLHSEERVVEATNYELSQIRNLAVRSAKEVRLT